MKTRYLTMSASNETNTNGESYPDVLSFPISKFKFNDPLQKVTVTQRYKERFYLICFDAYGVSEYDDIILCLNGISSVYLLEPGDTIYIPSKSDLNKFLVEYKVDTEWIQ